MVGFPINDYPNSFEHSLVMTDNTWYEVSAKFEPSNGGVLVTLTVNGQVWGPKQYNVNVLQDANGPQLGCNFKCMVVAGVVLVS